MLVILIVYPRSFDYFSPKSLKEALELLGGDPELKILAGGQSRIPSLKLRALAVKGLVDITRIKELCYARQEGHMLKIGALTTIATLENDRTVTSSLPILRELRSRLLTRW